MEAFLDIIENYQRANDTEEELQEVFKIFEKNNTKLIIKILLNLRYNIKMPFDKNIFLLYFYIFHIVYSILLKII